MNCQSLLEAALQKSLSSSTRGHDPSQVLLDAAANSPRRATTGALERMGIDRDSLEELGLDKTVQDRVYKILYVYSEGFFSFIKELNDEARKRLWFTFLRLTETSFSAICAVDSTLRQEYERSLRTLLSEHNKLIQQSRAEFDNVQEQMQEQMSREAASRHKAKLDSALTQCRRMQLEEYTTQIVEELRQERDLNQRLAEEILSQRESLALNSSRIQVLEAHNEGLNKVSQELETVTEAWRRLSAEKQVAQYEKSRADGERERMKKTLVEGLTKTDTLIRENEENKAKLAMLTSSLGETTNKLLSVENKHAATLERMERLQSNYCKTHSLLFLVDKLCASVFQYPLDRIDFYGNLVFSESVPDNGDELFAAAEAVDRGTFIEMSSQLKLKLSETESHLKNAKTELVSSSCKLAASQFVAQRVWSEAVEKQHIHMDRIQQRTLTGATELLSLTEKVSLLEGELESLQTATAERDDAKKRLAAAASREQLLAIELEHVSINLRRKTAEWEAQCEQLGSLGSSLSLQENEINALKSDAASLREVAKRSVAEAERKTKHLGILNLTIENISSVFKLLLNELVRVGDVVEEEIKCIEVAGSGDAIPGKGGSRTQQKQAGMSGSSSLSSICPPTFQQCKSGIEGDESLLPREKSAILEVMTRVVGLEAEISRVLGLARERNDFAYRHRTSEVELSKLKAWARAERQRFVADAERQKKKSEEREVQSGLLVDQLQKERKEQSAAIHDLRNELIRVNNTHEVLVDKLRQLRIPEVEGILKPALVEVVHANQADEEIKVSWDFDEDLIPSAKEGTTAQSNFVSFEEFSVANKAAPPMGQKAGKSPLEQLRL